MYICLVITCAQSHTCRHIQIQTHTYTHTQKVQTNEIYQNSYIPKKKKNDVDDGNHIVKVLTIIIITIVIKATMVGMQYDSSIRVQFFANRHVQIKLSFKQIPRYTTMQGLFQETLQNSS